MARGDSSGRPTMVDVARVAQVALSTVSRVVNGDPGARPETVEKVTAAIAFLGWEADERALLRAEDEGMGGGEHSHLHKVHAALDHLRLTTFALIGATQHTRARSRLECR